MRHPPSLLVSPVTYQGGKQRLAGAILDVMGVKEARGGTVFYDLCCGSGAVTVELLNRGWAADAIVMVDIGPWGSFWKALGAGTFDMGRFEALVRSMPAEVGDIQAWLVAQAAQPVREDEVPYLFPILQAGAFGSKAVWTEGSRWRTPGFRSYWLPTATSSRRSPVNPMMPMPETLLERVAALVPRALGLRALRASVETTPWDTAWGGLVYLDPPYAGTTTYGGGFDILAFARSCPFPTWVSEGRALTPGAVGLAMGRRKGGISGDRTEAHDEWLSPFGP